MKPRNRIAACLAAVFCLGAPVTMADGESDETGLRHLKEVLWPKAYAEQDVELLDSILADEFRLIDGDGNWFTKDDELEYIRKNKPAYDSLVFSVKRLDVFGNDAAIVAGEGTITGQDDDGSYVMTYQSTNVLVKSGGEWKAVSSHVSGAKRVATD